MKPLTAGLVCLAALFSSQVNAQTKPDNTLKLPPAAIKIDGEITEWGDSLRYYNTEKKLNYSLANDKDNLYMAIRINDRTEQMRILNAGLTLSVNTKGKKKETYSITFPVGNPDSQPEPGARMPNPEDLTTNERDDMMRARLTRLRNIKVTGFPDIESDIITTANTYGIQVAVSYDKDGYLNYEAAVPLKFFHAESPDKSEWAFNIKINGVTRPGAANKGEGPEAGGMGGGRGGMGGGRGGMGGGRGGMGGGRGGMGGGRGGMGGGTQNSGDRSEMSKSVDFWEKFYLSKGQ